MLGGLTIVNSSETTHFRSGNGVADVRYLYPECGRQCTMITKGHCSEYHQMERNELFAQYSF